MSKTYSNWVDIYIFRDRVVGQWLRVSSALKKDHLSLVPAPMLGSSQPPITPIPGNLTSWVHAHTRTPHTIRVNLKKLKYQPGDGGARL